MIIKDNIIKNIMDYRISNEIDLYRISPNIAEVGATVISDVDSAFNGDSIPRIEYMSVTDSSTLNGNMTKIITYLNSISESAKQMDEEHRVAIKSYDDLCDRITNMFPELNIKLDKLLNYFCYNISPKPSNQTSNSCSGVIGNIITLPYYIGSAKMYNDVASMSCTSTSDITFSNLETISSIPLNTLPSIKVSDNVPVITINLSINVSRTMANALYIKFDNPIKEALFSFNLNGAQQYSEKRTSSEVLLNFLPIEFDTIQITVKVNNPNTDKPISVQISDIDIFKNIQFAKKGIFESKSQEIDNFTSANYVSMTYKKIGDASTTNVDQLVSLSFDSNISSFNKIDKDVNADISLYKYKYTDEVTSFTDLELHGKILNSMPITNTDSTLWDINCSNAVILYGLNKKYATQNASIDERYENWHKSGNFYITTILNYEEGITINIGSKKCTINGKEQTGIIKIPVGISVIQVHEKDIELVDISNKNNTINPLNFAYLFAGLPVYNDAGSIDAMVLSKEFSVKNTTTILLGESFIPMTEIVEDTYGNVYRLSLTQAPYVPGTYSIEPNSGKIKVNPLDGVSQIYISYTKAQANRKACGILCNRLLTFTNPNKINSVSDTSLMESNDMLFTVHGTETSKYLLLPKLATQPFYSQILYNTSKENMYISARLEMESGNRYLTPIIENVFISVK